MTDALAALRASNERLRVIVDALDADQLGTRAYPAEWTIAQVCSHLGSGAVILRRRVDDVIAGIDADPAFAPSVWEAWNAKTSEHQAAEVIEADRELLEYFESLRDDPPEQFSFALGPVELDLGGVIALRLNEHVLHTWDIDVALHPTATLPSLETALVIDNLELIARFSGTPTGTEREMCVQTHEPDRWFRVSLGADSVSLAPGPDGERPDVELAAEAFIRLIYGRLDAAHAPPVAAPDLLDAMRRAFPGF